MAVLPPADAFHVAVCAFCQPLLCEACGLAGFAKLRPDDLAAGEDPSWRRLAVHPSTLD